MGHRISKIYTKTGDDGSTGLGSGDRVRKDSTRIDLIGDIDELNSSIGIILNFELPSSLGDVLTSVQHRLFDLGGEMSLPGYTLIKTQHSLQVENWIDELNRDLEPLKEFILPRGKGATAYVHLARSICRRAERQAIRLANNDEVNSESIIYLNRLSDLLFVICRICNRFYGDDAGKEIYWNKNS